MRIAAAKAARDTRATMGVKARIVVDEKVAEGVCVCVRLLVWCPRLMRREEERHTSFYTEGGRVCSAGQGAYKSAPACWR